MSAGKWKNPRAEYCPHCGALKAAHALAAHVAKCPFRPEIWQATRAALDDGTGYIKPYQQYQKETDGGKARENVPAVSVLMTTFTSWSATAEAFDLLVHPGRTPAKRVAPIDRKVDEIAASTGQLVIEREIGILPPAFILIAAVVFWPLMVMWAIKP